jgi:hypothetical protein
MIFGSAVMWGFQSMSISTISRQYSTASPGAPNARRQRRADTTPAKQGDADRRVRWTPKLDRLLT